MKKIGSNFTDIYSFFILKKKISEFRTEKIFSKLRVGKTFKTTSNKRMQDVNMQLKKYIDKYFSKKINICDIGISSGQSTLELYNDLKSSQIEYIYGFDKQIYLKIYKIKKLILLYSSANDLLMVEYNKYCLRYRYFFILKKIDKIIYILIKFFNVKYKKSKTLTPKLNRIRKCKFFEQDIFSVKNNYYDLFDVIRVSNLLNLSYFSEKNIKLAISNINKISKKNSIIVINRTNNKKKNLTSFFIKKNSKFHLLKDLNGGSEIKNLFLSF